MGDPAGKDRRPAARRGSEGISTQKFQRPTGRRNHERLRRRLGGTNVFEILGLDMMQAAGVGFDQETSPRRAERPLSGPMIV